MVWQSKVTWSSRQLNTLCFNPLVVTLVSSLVTLWAAATAVLDRLLSDKMPQKNRICQWDKHSFIAPHWVSQDTSNHKVDSDASKKMQRSAMLDSISFNTLRNSLQFWNLDLRSWNLLLRPICTQSSCQTWFLAWMTQNSHTNVNTLSQPTCQLKLVGAEEKANLEEGLVRVVTQKAHSQHRTPKRPSKPLESSSRQKKAKEYYRSPCWYLAKDVWPIWSWPRCIAQKIRKQCNQPRSFRSTKNNVITAATSTQKSYILPVPQFVSKFKHGCIFYQILLLWFRWFTSISN